MTVERRPGPEPFELRRAVGGFSSRRKGAACSSGPGRWSPTCARSRRQSKACRPGLADSIAASWGPGVVAQALTALPGVEVDLRRVQQRAADRKLRLGRYHIVISSDAPTSAELIHYPVTDEPMVLIHSGFTTKAGKDAPLITIEQSSATWRAIEPALREHQPQAFARRIIPVESFSAALQMVKAGFGDGLAHRGDGGLLQALSAAGGSISAKRACGLSCAGRGQA